MRSDGVPERITLAVAESCTGGLLSARLVAIPGSGSWYRGAVVAYDADVKFDLLDVTRGPVVTAAAAEEMAQGVRRLLDTDIGGAVTGVAGPATEEGNPVGTVFVAVTSPAGTVCEGHQLFGDPHRIRRSATAVATQMLLGALRFSSDRRFSIAPDG